MRKTRSWYIIFQSVLFNLLKKYLRAKAKRMNEILEVFPTEKYAFQVCFSLLLNNEQIFLLKRINLYEMKYPIPRKQQFNQKTFPQSKERISVAIFTRVSKNVGSCFWFIEKTIAVFYVVVVVVERVVDIRNTTPTTRGHFCRLCGMLVPDLATYLDVLSLPGLNRGYPASYFKMKVR